MVSSRLLLALAALAPSLVTCQTTGEIDNDTLLDLFGTTEVENTAPTRYIVRFSDVGSSKFRKRDGTLAAEEFFSVLAETSPEATPATTFDSALFHGASFDVGNSSAEAVAEILALAEVAEVWPATIFTIPDAQETRVDRTASKYTKWNPHIGTNVDLAHARGYTGKGVVVAVVDSGVDYNHPALGGGFGPGFKAESGFDFVGDDYQVGGPYIPDNDPMDCNGHGTHVAGILASGDSSVRGVAPDVTLRSYKISGCGGSTMEDAIIAAFIKAHEDGADIITASLGSDRGFPNTPFTQLLEAIQAEGTFITIAAGNNGAAGPYSTSNGGNANGVTAVGSVNHGEYVAFAVLARSSGGDTREIAYIASQQLHFPVDGSLPAYADTDGRDADICPVTGSAPLAKRNAVLIHPRGQCVWQLHDTALIDRVDFAFYYNFPNASWEVPNRGLYRSDQAKGMALISYEDSDWLMSQFESGHEITFDFKQDNSPVAISKEVFEAGAMSYFSSWGLTLDARLKPEIAAPGSDIMSTYPVSGGSWAVLSGMSMATPYIAGVTALLFGARGGKAAMGPNVIQETYRRLIASGKPVRQSGLTWADDVPASTAHQGGGLVDAIKVIESTTAITPPILHLNDTANFVASHDFVVTNSGEQTVEYIVSHDPGSTTTTRPRGDAWLSQDPPLIWGPGNVAEAVLSEATFTLQPGESHTVSVTFTAPVDAGAATMPIYGGGIVFAGSKGEVLRVPYIGIKGSLYDQDTWELERGIPLFLYDSLVVRDGQTMAVKRGETPELFYNVLFATREISFDWVSGNWTEADWQYPPVVGEKNFKGHFIGPPQGLSLTIPVYPQYNVVRTNLFRFFSDSIFAHGEEIPPGEYRFLGRVLRTNGDPHNIKDWQYGLSAWMNITGDLPDPVPEPTTTAPPGPEPTRPCGSAGQQIRLTARVGDAQEAFDTYGYSDFLAIDFTGTQNNTGYELTPDGYIVRPDGSNILANNYMSVHTNANSLIYFRGSSSSQTGGFSRLDCEIRCEDKLRYATADVVPTYYICGRDSQGIIRRAASLL